MRNTITHIAPWMAAAAVCGALAFAPIASADTGPAPRIVSSTPAPTPPPAPSQRGASPLVPLGVNPDSQEPFDPYLKNPAGGVDLPS
jgi:hypothetical protein